MILSSALGVVLLVGASAGPQLCAGTSSIEPDLRILESDLGQSAAMSAVEKIKDMVAKGNLTGEFQFGALNQSKILYGHILLRQATADRDEFGPGSVESAESTRILCAWLDEEGFWHD